VEPISAVPPRGINLPIVIAVVLGIGFGASAYLNVAQYQRMDQERKLLKGEITDLRYQIDQDKKQIANLSGGATPTPSVTPTPSASPTPTPTPTVAGAATKTGTVNQPATLRSQASTSARPVRATKIPAGTKATITGDKVNGYWPVTLDGGESGYIIAIAVNI
jgi:hypothetical protein